jgi:capsular polysaccharide biosynthesis protein
MNEQPVDLRTSLQELRRHRLLIIFVAALCGIAGFAYGLVTPAKETAVSLVLLPPASNSGNSGNTGNSGAAGNSIDTSAVIARSTPVLSAAGAKMSPPLGALAVKQLVTVSPLSGQILQIQAKDPSSGYAAQLANAVAASYVTYVGQLQGSATRSAVAALQHESGLLTKQITDLQSQIDTVTSRIAAEGAGSSAGQQDTNLLGSLRSEQNQVSLQLNSVSGQITNSQFKSGSSVNTTRILQKAAIQPVSKYKLPVEAAIIGIAIGLLGSTAFVLVRLQSRRRPQLQDDIARLGAPVIGSLESPRCGSTSEWQDLLEGRRGATDEWAMRHILRTIATGEGGPQAIRVISFVNDALALTTGPRLALLAARSGTPTALLLEDSNVSGGTSLAPLRAAFNDSPPVGRGLPFTMGVGNTDEVQADLLVTVVVYDGPSANLSSSDAVNLLSISPSFVTADELAELALTTTDGGLVLDGVVVVNPDPTDDSTGSMRDDTLRLLPSIDRTEPDGEGARIRPRTSYAESPAERLTRQQR